MIIFTDNVSHIDIISRTQNRPIKVFNLSSLYSGFCDVTCLITKMANVLSNANSNMIIPQFVGSVEFDMYYMNSLLYEHDMFNAFMSIMSDAFEGIIVIVLIQRDPYRDTITESLIKIIQQRYGYNSWLIESEEDIYSIRESNFTPMGLITLQQDIAKFDETCNDPAKFRISIE